ncbi:MAG: MFS transporter [Desulfobacterium sp.]|nr:MFS transporter [Desulfobacterium sp.]MBU3948777.1 MFS transporter [Pseudomonadota bacterium]MBU4009980.1 MFS transporter [Pseudomonadota bacterium]MBU4037790.1 MFS transporter [Pseudomonadota bacterium]
MAADKYRPDEQTALKIIFRSLKHKNYRLFFIGQSISLIGTWIQRIAISWLVYKLTNSVFLLGVVGFADQIPTFLLSPLAGVLTDRLNRYHIMIVTQILAAIQALILACIYFYGIIDIWHIILLSVFLGSINAFDIPARHSLLVEMIEKKEDLGNAIALNSSMFNSARLLGPSIAGILIATTGEGTCFLINSVSYIVVIASILRMKIVPRIIIKKNTHVLTEIKEGFSYTFGFRPIKYVILLFGLVGLMGMPYSVLLPVFAKEILKGGSHTYGFLMGASGLGALIGALYLASKNSIRGLLKIVSWSSGIFGVGLIIFSLSRYFLLSMVLMVLIGFGMMLQLASSNTLLQTIVDDDKRGRVLSIYIMTLMGSATFGSLLAGGMAKFLGVPLTLAIGGISCISGAVIFARKLPELQKDGLIYTSKIGREVR